MAKSKNGSAPAVADHGIRIVGLDPNLHRALRLVAVRRGVAVREVYRAAITEFLSSTGEKVG